MELQGIPEPQAEDEEADHAEVFGRSTLQIKEKNLFSLFHNENFYI